MSPRMISREELHEHRSSRSCWVVVNNKVYDVTEFLFDHPGGEELILNHGGTDITEIMKDELSHFHSEASYEILEQFYIGEYSTDAKSDSVKSQYSVDPDSKSDKFVDIKKPMLVQVWKGNYSKEFYLKQVHIPRHAKDSPPIFGHWALELLTKTPWYVIPMVWLPVVYKFSRASLEELSAIQFSFYFLVGLFNWTWIEYVVHRFLFHVEKLLPDNRVGITLHFLMHGIHHFLPMDKMRLVMPPALFLILSTPVYHMYKTFLPFYVGQAIAAGSYFGYVMYDLCHYYVHHGVPFGKHLKEMKTYHLDHHYKNENLGFGITSKFWDKLFDTVLV